MPDYQKYCTPSLTETRHSLGDHEGRASDVYERIPAKLPGSPDGQGHCGTDVVTDVRHCGGAPVGTAPFIVTGLDFRCLHCPAGMRSRENPGGPLREKRENILQILVSHHPVNYYERGICIIVQISVQLGEVVGKGGSIVSYVADDVRTGRESLLSSVETGPHGSMHNRLRRLHPSDAEFRAELPKHVQRGKNRPEIHLVISSPQIHSVHYE